MDRERPERHEPDQSGEELKRSRCPADNESVWKLIGIVVATLALSAPTAARAQQQVIPVTIQPSMPTLAQGAQVQFSVAEPKGPCPKYVWTFSTPTGSSAIQGSRAATPSITVPAANSVVASVEITDACDGTVRSSTREFPV